MAEIDTPVLAPSTRPNLLDAANVIDGAPGYQFLEEHLYETRLVAPDNRDIPAEGEEKVFGDRDGVEHTETKLFGAYRGANEQLMRGVGYGSSEVGELFTLGEALFVEGKVQELLLNPAATDITPTPGTPVTNIKAAIGLLEQWIATRYLYRPTISGDLLAVNLIEDTKPPSSLETTAKTPIALAAGYGADGPGAVVAAEGQAWLYIHGQVNIWRSATATYPAQDLINNRELHLVERQYAASLDGPAAAILVGF